MQLLYFLVVIVSLSCGSIPSPANEFVSDHGISGPLIATLGLVSVWAALCHLGSWLVARQVVTEQLEPMVGARWIERQLEVFRWLSLFVIVLCLAGFGLAQAISVAPVLRDSMALQSIILLAPGLMMTFASWSAEQAYGVRLNYTEGGFRNHTRSLWLSFRSGLAWLVAPVLMLLGVSDLISLLPLSENTASWITGAIVISFVVMGLPLLIRKLFKTTEISPGVNQWVVDLLVLAKIKSTKPMRWDTGGRAFNAMVAGFVPRFRSLLLSDRLLDELGREQIAMVVLHEAAHLRRRHVPLRMLAILPAWIAAVLVTQIAGDSHWALPLGSAAGILLTMLILRIVAYRSEYDADVQACKMAVEISSQLHGVPSTYEAACDSLSSALMRVTFDHPAARKPTWLHPGVADRVAWMRRHRSEPMANSTVAGTIANPDQPCQLIN
ncbi:Peptidase family M48 [Planctomycetes bacterium K23_9]|uniref:Peptidase family M48 n=2 Tax=Stieleria marina TaxID=1930275 RepID=A0A517NZ98_9BACT|nr:Peptidase family M48 [Planctomycetes bacterium K23_9]